MIPFKAFGIVKSVYPKNFVFKAFSVHIKTQGGGFKLSSLKRIFEKFRFRRGNYVPIWTWWFRTNGWIRINTSSEVGDKWGWSNDMLADSDVRKSFEL